ncbi:MAG: DUF2157 domain-containing protein [Desulfobacterales bacterium]|nr:DUF2157 domain-containing protein [Desulfobacterales bacterium]
MNNNVPDIDRICDLKELKILYNKGLITEETYNDFLESHFPQNWGPFVSKTILSIASLLILAGIIYFFAYNWSSMDKFLKFGLLQSSILISIGIAHYKGFDKLSGKLFLLSAAVLTGVLLAVFGQIYQTGADSHELFRGWLLLIAGWVLISNFASLWFIFYTLLIVWIILYFDQVVGPKSHDTIFLIVASVTFAFLTLKEILFEFGLKWLEGLWIRYVLISILLTNLTIPVFYLIFSSGYSHRIEYSPVLWLLTIIIAGYFYRKRYKDIICLTLITLSICLVLSSIIIENIGDSISFSNFTPFFIITIGISSIFAVASFLMINLNKSIKMELNETDK